jgi:hypothetical protein
MNQLVHSFDLPRIGEPHGFFVNGNFIVFRYWADSLAGENYLENASGFDSTTIYIRHASGLPVPVRVSPETGVNLKNDHGSPLQNISLCAIEFDEEVFSLKELSQGKLVRLEFIRKGRYCLHYEWMESDIRKEAHVDMVVG